MIKAIVCCVTRTFRKRKCFFFTQPRLRQLKIIEPILNWVGAVFSSLVLKCAKLFTDIDRSHAVPYSPMIIANWHPLTPPPTHTFKIWGSQLITRGWKKPLTVKSIVITFKNNSELPFQTSKHVQLKLLRSSFWKSWHIHGNSDPSAKKCTSAKLSWWINPLLQIVCQALIWQPGAVSPNFLCTQRIQPAIRTPAID